MSLDTYQHVFEPGADAGAPVLLLLHGTGSTAQAFIEFGRAIAPAATKLALQGDVDEHGQARFFRRFAEGVYDLEDLAYRTDRMAAFIDAAKTVYGLAPERLIGVGYSNGANILANVLFEHPTIVRRAALMHPLFQFEPPRPDLSETEILITAGRRDPICPPDMTEALADAYRERSAKTSLVWRPGGHNIDAEELDAVRAFAI